VLGATAPASPPGSVSGCWPPRADARQHQRASCMDARRRHSASHPAGRAAAGHDSQTLGIVAKQHPRRGATPPRGCAQSSAGLPTSGALSSWPDVQSAAAPPRVAACIAPLVCRAAGRPSSLPRSRVPVPQCPRLGVPTLSPPSPETCPYCQLMLQTEFLKRYAISTCLQLC
jgi:hypothetical protein